MSYFSKQSIMPSPPGRWLCSAKQSLVFFGRGWRERYVEAFYGVIGPQGLEKAVRPT
jgi:hypothetical protein